MGISSACKLKCCLRDKALSDDDSGIMASSGTHFTSDDDSSIVSNATSYDVFLSFRGKDTRDSFTDHLYDALQRAGFLTFRDNNEINRGQELKPEIERAIKASKASIVVLSKNYATSTWCLDELWLILKQRKECNHFVLPVYYHVDPSDVRKQSKTFNIKVKSSTRWTNDNINRWKTSLTMVADLTGLVLSGPETKFLKEIIDTIYNKLDHKEVYLPPNLTGIDIRYKEIMSWLYEPNLPYLAICGMGGSGKTTLAKYIYNSNQKKFENTSFVEDIGSKCQSLCGLRELQEQILKDILGGRKKRIPSVSLGTAKIEKTLQTKRALLVLDNVVGYNELVALLGTGEINSRSKIIITSEDIISWFNFSPHKCQQHRIKLLNDDESLELLSRHAFGSKVPMEGFEELAVQAVKYCEGNPLALEVLGSSLSNSNTIPYWRSQLGVLKKYIHLRIKNVLERSLNSLPYDSEKQLFLHIACFFIGKDMDYVAKILEPDYSAVSGIKTLINRCLLSVSSSNKLMMHRLLQEMGRNMVCQESFMHPLSRSRVWLSSDSYKILKKGKGSKTIEGLTLDMKTLRGDDVAFKVLQSLQILNLKDSHNLSGIFNISRIPRLETLIVWNCHCLVHICDTIRDLASLTLLNMIGCKNLCKRIQKNLLKTLKASTSGGEVAEPPTFSLPHSLERLFLNYCNLIYADSFPLSFSDQLFLQYLNLSNNLFEFFPYYDHLKSLRVLDLSFCLRLKWLQRLPSTLAELYVYYCESLEKITFQSPRFTLQEFGYEGCINLSDTEGFFKLIPIAKLDETDMGHMKWLKEYQNHKVLLVGDDELTIGRIQHIQMLYEFDIMSTTLSNIKDSNMMPEYISQLPSVSFHVPPCPKNRRLKGLNVSFMYTLFGDNWIWFAKINTIGTDLIYNPKVFGKPGIGETGVWLSYWPIGNTLAVGNKVKVSIEVMRGVLVRGCGASLVYADDELAKETLENNMQWVETIGGDLSRFQLRRGVYYLCRRDFFDLMEVDRLTPGWLSDLVGETIDDSEVRGWRKTGRPMQLTPSFTELKTVRCIIDGPPLEEIYNIAEMSKSSLQDKTVKFTSSKLKGEMFIHGTTSKTRGDATKGKSVRFNQEIMEIPRTFVSPREKPKSVGTDEVISHPIKIVLRVNFCGKPQSSHKVLKTLSRLKGVESVEVDTEEGTLIVTGTIDPGELVIRVRKVTKYAEILSVGPKNSKKQVPDPKTGDAHASGSITKDLDLPEKDKDVP